MICDFYVKVTLMACQQAIIYYKKWFQFNNIGENDKASSTENVFIAVVPCGVIKGEKMKSKWTARQ